MNDIAEFKEMLVYAQRMEFDEEPDYEYLENLLLLIKDRYNFEDGYEWESPSFGQPNPTDELNAIKRKKRSKLGRKPVNKKLTTQNAHLCPVSPTKFGDQSM